MRYYIANCFIYIYIYIYIYIFHERATSTTSKVIDSFLCFYLKSLLNLMHDSPAIGISYLKECTTTMEVVQKLLLLKIHITLHIILILML